MYLYQICIVNITKSGIIWDLLLFNIVYSIQQIITQDLRFEIEIEKNAYTSFKDSIVKLTWFSNRNANIKKNIIVVNNCLYSFSYFQFCYT